MTSYTVAFLSPEPVTMYLSSEEMSQLNTEDVSLETKMEAPYGALHAFKRLSLPVLANHLPELANLRDNTQLSCRCNWYLSGLEQCRTSTFELSMPTASQSPVGQ